MPQLRKHASQEPSRATRDEPRSPRPNAARPGRPRGGFTQHRRLDALRAILQRHPTGLTLVELADSLRVSTRSLRRYLREIERELDLVASPERPGGSRVWRLAPGEVPRKVDIRRTQAYALLAARTLFEPLRGTTLFEEIDLASQRLLGVARRPGRGPNAGVADARLEERFLYVPFAPKNYAERGEVLDDVFQAVADLRPLRCHVIGPDGREERALLHPYAMVIYKDAVHVVARHVERDATIAIAVDRMRDTECVTDDRFELPASFSIDAWAQGQFGLWPPGEPTRVVVDLDASVAEIVASRRVHPTQELAPRDDGTVRLTLHLSDLTEVATWVLGFGETARVVEPPELATQVRERLERALARYASNAGRPEDPASAPRAASRRRKGSA